MSSIDELIEDLNGDHYLGSQEGESLVFNKAYGFMFPFGCPCATNPFEKVTLPKNDVIAFIEVNATYLKHVMPNLTVGDIAVIVWHRLLAVNEGLVSPKFIPANYYVDYTDCVQMDDKSTKERDQAPSFIGHGAIIAALSAQTRKDIKETFVDRVCMIAYVFRARGHHYIDQYQDLYVRLWDKCRYKPDTLHITYQNMATVALHAIFPIVLDNFWRDMCLASKVNGALVKRFDSAPAGMAGPAVLKQGVEDLMMIAPGIKDRLSDAMAYLTELYNKMAQNRWNGSVNCRYYGAVRIAVDEKRLSAIAATVFAASSNLAPEAQINGSKALKRIATNAPITGAVLGRAIGQIANREEVIFPLLKGSDNNNINNPE